MSFPKYDRYKDSGVEWLGEVPEHWKITQLKHIVAIPITDGPHETPEFLDEGVSFVSAEAISSGMIDFSKIRGFISEEVNKRYSQKYSPKLHDIYLIKSGATTGTTAIVESRTDFNIWSPLAAIRCSEIVNPYFVLNFMRSKNFQEAVTLNWSFGTQQNIGMRVIENLAHTLPPLPEQRSIATFLDRETTKIDELIAEQRQLIDLLKEKRQAVISHAVTKGLNPDAPMKDSAIEWLGEVPEHWEVLCLKRWWSITDCKHLTAEFVEDGIPLASIREVQSWYVDLSEAKQTTEYFYQQLTEGGRKPLVGDLIFSRNATVGEVAQVTEEHPKFTMGQDVCLLRKNLSDMSSNFLQFQIKSHIVQVQLSNIMVGSTFKRVNVEEIRNLIVPLPPAIEQQEIANLLIKKSGEFDELIAEAHHAIALLQERRTALISAAVTGKIDVRSLV